MRFSVVMPSYLGDYPGAAADRDAKLVRAINSVIKQTLPDWELVIVADGCTKTLQIVREQITDERVDVVSIPKQKMWSGEARATGVKHSKGEYICYLDIDDILGADHLEVINSQLNGEDWVYFNDLIYREKHDNFDSRVALPGKLGKCGTSNICHKRGIGNIWNAKGYAREDLQASRMLIRLSANYKIIETPSYFVCHIPNKYDI